MGLRHADCGLNLCVYHELSLELTCMVHEMSFHLSCVLCCIPVSSHSQVLQPLVEKATAYILLPQTWGHRGGIALHSAIISYDFQKRVFPSFQGHRVL